MPREPIERPIEERRARGVAHIHPRRGESGPRLISLHHRYDSIKERRSSNGRHLAQTFPMVSV